jgi:hypothetical protein
MTARIGEMIATVVSLLVAPGLAFGQVAAGEGNQPLHVKAVVAPGPYVVGQGFVLRVEVLAGSKRPKIDAPRMTDALAWTIDTKRRPISSSRIGSVVAAVNLFVVQFRVVAKRAGALEIPAVQAQIDGRSGRSQPKRLLIQPVPLQGRPAEFLGGVGRSDVQAAASPNVLRVGQELDFRIKVTGPGAWGMNDRPNLERFERLGLDLRIQARPDETNEEPPVRTFVYRLRPTRAGEAVLPPVAIASFDPALARYVTHVTAGVPIRAVAVSAFDPATIDYDPPSTGMTWQALFVVAATPVVICLLWVSIAFKQMRRRQRSHPIGPAPARRYANRTARYLRSVSVEAYEHEVEPGIRTLCVERLTFAGTESPLELFQPAKSYRLWGRTILTSGTPNVVRSVARRIAERLAIYLQLGTGHPLSTLTPEEARQGVTCLTGSAELAAHASKLTERCDSILYGDSPRLPDQAARELIDDARRLFQGLGRVKISNWHAS